MAVFTGEIASQRRTGGPDAEAVFRGNGETTWQPFSPLFQNGLYHAHAIRWALIVQAEQQDTAVCLVVEKDEFAEILVVGNKNSGLTRSPGQDIRIIGLGHCFGDSNYIVTGSTQELHYSFAGRFVYDKPHGDCCLAGNGKGENILPSQHLGCIGQGGSDIVRLQTRILMQDFMLREALGQHPHDQLDRDTSSPDYRLADHDSRVYGNALSKLFIHRIPSAPHESLEYTTACSISDSRNAVKGV